MIARSASRDEAISNKRPLSAQRLLRCRSQWSFWGMTEVERPVLTALLNRAILPGDKRDAAAADDAEKQLAQPLVHDGALDRAANLIGDNFTVADLNVASILAWARPAQIGMSPFPKVAEWLKNCAERPAARQLQRE
jgi:glutathione S-transferase